MKENYMKTDAYDPYGTKTFTTTTSDVCFICGNTGWYRDYRGVWHKCPRCTNNNDVVWIKTYDDYPYTIYNAGAGTITINKE